MPPIKKYISNDVTVSKKKKSKILQKLLVYLLS